MKTHFADTVLMVRPSAFGANAQTETDNHFQKKLSLDQESLQQAALLEFDKMTSTLRQAGIQVVVAQDDPKIAKPDAVFPNNWFTCMHGMLTLFPMKAENRRAERTAVSINAIKNTVPDLKVKDLSGSESGNQFLEGTGSMVIDHCNRVVYACKSERTHPDLLKNFADDNGFALVVFDAHDANDRAIYHTNVLMCIGNGFAIVCMEALPPADREQVQGSLAATGLALIPISFAQMDAFAGNMLQLQNAEGLPLLIMSSTADNVLTPEQKSELEKKTEFVVIDIPTIEAVGGGGVRCMMAELFTA